MHLRTGDPDMGAVLGPTWVHPNQPIVMASCWGPMLGKREMRFVGEMALPDREGEELVQDTGNYPVFLTLARVVPTYNHAHPLPTMLEINDNDARWILACVHDHLKVYVRKLWGILLGVVEPLDKVDT